jgi:hypothetical protein
MLTLYFSVLWIRNYFFRILGSVVLNYGSGSRRPINYGFGRIRIPPDIFVVVDKNMLSNWYLIIKYYKMLNFFSEISYNLF